MVDPTAIYTGIGVVVANGAFFKISAFFVKRWMDQKDASEVQTKKDLKDAAEKLAADLKDSAGKLAGELKEATIEHRQEIKTMTDKLDVSLTEIFTQLRVANGRTAKIEGGVIEAKGGLAKIEALCAEKHKNDRRQAER